MRTLVGIGFLVAIGCGTPAPQQPDGGAPDAGADGDVIGRDGAEPLPRRYVDPLWVRGVHWGAGELIQSVMVPSGVVLLAEPNMSLYDRSGNLLASVPWPPTAAVGWSVSLPRPLASGGFAVVTQSPDYDNVVRRYAGSDLTELPAVELPNRMAGVSLVELGASIYAVTSDGSGVHRLHELSADSVVESRDLTLAEGYWLSRRGYVTSDGQLLFCGADETGMVMIQIDPVTADATTVDLGIQNSAASCRIVRSDNGMIAMWQRYGYTEWVLMDRDGTELRAGPFTVEDFGQLRLERTPTTVVYAGGQYIILARTTDRVMLHAIDETTGEIHPPWDVKLEPGDEFYDIDRATLVTDGDHLYVGTGNSVPPPFRIKLQKLPLLGSLGAQ